MMPRRQFDSQFKQTIVRLADSIKQNKDHGGIKKLLDTHRISSVQLCYWRKQHKQGHFTSNRAVAFSRKPEMVHG